MPGRGSEARRGRGASGVFTGQRIRLELRGLERSRLASVLVPRAVGAVPLWVSPAEQPRSHAAGGLARTSARRSGVGGGASVRSIQHGLGTQRAPSRLPPARPSSCPGPLPPSRLMATFYHGGMLGMLGTALQSQALWPFCPSD